MSRVRLSEREEESLSCYLRACDAALSFLQELDKVPVPVVLVLHCCYLINIIKYNFYLSKNFVRFFFFLTIFTSRSGSIFLSEKKERKILVITCCDDDDDVTDSNYTSPQDQQDQSSASTCGHGPGLLPPGCSAERLPLSAAPRVS